MKKAFAFLLTLTLIFNIAIFKSDNIVDADTISTKSAIITANTTYLRSGRGTSYSKLKTLSKNNIVTVTGYKGNWLKVKSGTKTGYILSKYATIMKDQTTKSSVNFRTDPGTSYSIISKLPKNKKVYLISKSGKWSKIYYNGKIGYLSSSYIKGKYRICIDAGHQTVGDTSKEPIAPGSSKLKYKTSYGAIGKYTKIPEYKTNLSASKVLRSILEDRGYEVIMIRDINDVKMSNVERAQFANKNNCDLAIRIHCNYADDNYTKGAAIFTPSYNNKYISSSAYKAIYKPSYNISKLINTNLKQKGIKMLGSEIYKTSELTGFNWSEVPCVLFEMGFMSNKTDDYNLNDTAYQKKFMQGVANGLDDYFK